MNEILNYIKEQQLAGYTDEQIQTALIQAGHSESSIKALFLENNSQVSSVDERQLNTTAQEGEVALHQINNIVGASFFAGPIVGIWMVYQNYKRLGMLQEANKALYVGTGMFFIVLSILWFMSDVTNLHPFKYFPGINLVLVWSLAVQLQGKLLEEHKAKNGAFVSLSKTIVITLISLPVTIIVILLAALIFGIFESLFLK